MLKRLSLCVLLMLISLFALISCKKKIDYSKIKSEKPVTEIQTGDYELDFTIMHNSVIDYLSSEVMPFFFIKENGFDISGNNTDKSINLTCKCLDGTTIEDLNLFLSMALNGIALNAAEQDYRFKSPNVDNEGTYLDFGTVFNVYSLQINATCDDGTVLMDKVFKAGEKITIDPRYIKE